MTIPLPTYILIYFGQVCSLEGSKVSLLYWGYALCNRSHEIYGSTPTVLFMRNSLLRRFSFPVKIGGGLETHLSTSDLTLILI